VDWGELAGMACSHRPDPTPPHPLDQLPERAFDLKHAHRVQHGVADIYFQSLNNPVPARHRLLRDLAVIYFSNYLNR